MSNYLIWLFDNYADSPVKSAVVIYNRYLYRLVGNYRCHWHRWISMTPVSLSGMRSNNDEPQNDERVFVHTNPGYVFSGFLVSFRICCSGCYFLFFLTWFETKRNTSEKEKMLFKSFAYSWKQEKLLFNIFLESRKEIIGELLSFLAVKVNYKTYISVGWWMCH